MKRQFIVTEEGPIDAIVGYRAWEAWAADGVIHMTSVTRREVEWPRAEALRSECRCHGHGYNAVARVGSGAKQVIMPGETYHTCGIYAWKAPIIPYSHRLLGLQVGYHYHYVVGEVLLWGKVHAHERGYRAEIAKPAALYVTATMSARQTMLVELTALQWGIPVVLVDRPQDVDSFRAAVDRRTGLYP